MTGDNFREDMMETCQIKAHRRTVSIRECEQKEFLWHSPSLYYHIGNIDGITMRHEIKPIAFGIFSFLKRMYYMKYIYMYHSF